MLSYDISQRIMLTDIIGRFAYYCFFARAELFIHSVFWSTVGFLILFLIPGLVGWALRYPKGSSSLNLKSDSTVLTIAHVSDIHLERRDADVADQLLEILVKVNPNLLIISGDLVDNFWNLHLAKKWLLDTCAKLQLDPLQQVIVVPGNHDYRILGNLGLRPLTALCFRILFRPWNRRRILLLKRFGVSIWRFDSNPIFRGFAKGKVSKWQLSRIRKERDALSSEDRNFVRNSTKIAVLHHHPLPVPNEGGDTFLMLDKAQNIIQFFAEERIDCVLHGHKHRAPYSLLALGTCTGESRDIEFIGAGTAVAKAPDREQRGHNVNVVTVEDTGLLYIRQFFAQPGQPFMEAPTRNYLPQACERVHRHALQRGHKFERIHWDQTFDNDGDVFNQFTYKGLVPTVGQSVERHGDHTFSCTTGHLSRVQLDGKKTSPGITIADMQVEQREIKFSIVLDPAATTKHPKDFVIQSYDFNTVALDQESYRRKYPKSKMNWMESETKELIEATNHFSWLLSFPPEFRPTHEPKFEVLDDSDKVHEWLTDALQHCFSYSEQIGLASVTIDKPPANYQYRISWYLPPSYPHTLEKTNPAHRTIVTNFAEEMLKLRSVHDHAKTHHIMNVLQVFSKLIEERIEELCRTKNVVEPNGIEISLMVMDHTEQAEVPKLRVITGTQVSEKTIREFYLEIGDGIAGRAYNRNAVRMFDADEARHDPKFETYVSRGTGTQHDFLISIPLRHPVSQHLIFGVLNIGSFDPNQGRLLAMLGDEKGAQWLLEIAQAYCLKEFLALANITITGGDHE